MADSNDMFEDADPMFAAFSAIPDQSLVGNVRQDLLGGFTELFMGEDSGDEAFEGFTSQDLFDEEDDFHPLSRMVNGADGFSAEDEEPLQRNPVYTADGFLTEDEEPLVNPLLHDDDGFLTEDEEPLDRLRVGALPDEQPAPDLDPPQDAQPVADLEAPVIGAQPDGQDPPPVGRPNRQFHWRDGDVPRREYNFTGGQGLSPLIQLGEEPDFIDFVNIFLGDNDYQDMTDETNRYASKYLRETTLSPSSRFRDWPANGITIDDMKCFLALTVVMGIVVHEDIPSYWSTDCALQTPFFPAVMSRNRFLNILSFFHLSDNETIPRRGNEGYDPLRKLGSSFSNLVSRFETAWQPGQHVSIDEGMIAFRGRVHFRCYMPDKPDKYGMKSFMLCDSSNGYCSKFELYTGVRHEEPSRDGITYDLVMRMMQPYLHCGRILYVDNYYTSPSLFYDLALAGTGATGTARRRKFMPPNVTDLKLKRKGEKKVMHSGDLVCSKILDRKPVMLLSTAHTMEEVATGKRDVRGVIIKRAEMIHRYNQNMGAVDVFDQMLSYSSFRRRSLKWWKKVFFHVFSTAILNAYIIYKDWCSQHRKTPKLQKAFRVGYAKELISTVRQLPKAEQRIGRPSQAVGNLVRLTGRHFPNKLQGTGDKRISRKCRVCNPAEKQILAAQNVFKRRSGRESSYECSDCKVALCVTPCFQLYHTHVDFISAYKRQKAVADDAATN